MRPLTTAFAGLAALLILAESAFAAGKTAEAPASRAASNELSCLAEAVYFEAGGTGSSGAAAVAHVVVNRTKSSKFPGSVCAVVRDGCQFSYKCDGRSDSLANPERRAQAMATARAVLSGAPDITNGALFFHAASAKPGGWFKSRPQVGLIGGNVFYR